MTVFCGFKETIYFFNINIFNVFCLLVLLLNLFRHLIEYNNITNLLD